MDPPSILETDVPSFATLERLDDVLGGGGGEPALRRQVPEVRRLLRCGITLLAIDGVTGSGKTREIPYPAQQVIGGKLLLIAKSTLDVVKLCEDLACPSRYCMGLHREGGVAIEWAHIVIATIGLTSRWYTSHGEDFVWRYEAVYFDELGEMEQDPEYALVFDAVLRAREKRRLVVLAAGSSLSTALQERLTELGAAWIRCYERPYPVQQNRMRVLTRDCFYEAVAFLAASLLRRGGTILVFLPGKAEIEYVARMLAEAKVLRDQLCKLHGDLDEAVKASVVRGGRRARIILSTSIAETAVTVPDVDFVIDTGFCRTSTEWDDILEFQDLLASKAVQEQRIGRAGRVKPGASVLVVAQENVCMPTTIPMCIDSVARVVALERYHFRVPPEGLSLCHISEEVLEMARQHLCDLDLHEDRMWDALTRIPLSLKDAAIFFKARDYDVGYEAAAILAVKSAVQVKATASLNVTELVEAVGGSRFRPVSWDTRVPKLPRAREFFQCMCNTFCLEKILENPFLVEQSLSVAFLVGPERLVWGVAGTRVPSFLGERFAKCDVDGCFVVALLTNSFGGLLCPLKLPYTHWVEQQSGVHKPIQTANVIGDSTFARFRTEICMRLRVYGYDVSIFWCRGGAWENQVAVHIASAPHVDLCIGVPNGNRLSLQTRTATPKWLGPCCEQICAAMKVTADRGVVFVGDASLSPGVSHVEAYATLVQQVRAKFLRLGVPLVSQAPDIELEADGIHWRVTSRQTVERLIDTLIEKGGATRSFKCSKPPMLWNWCFNGVHKKHYPHCIACRRIPTDAHLESGVHLAYCGGSQLSFDFVNRVQYCAEGVEFYVACAEGSTVDTTQFLPAERPVPAARCGDDGLRCRQIASVELLHCSGPRSPNCGIAQRCQVRISFGPGGPPSYVDWYLYHSSGRARDAFAAREKPLILKMQCTGEGIRNRNQEEWNAYRSSSSIRKIVPRVYGYAEQVVGGKRVSFLLVDRMAFTFATMANKLARAPVSDMTLKLVCRCVVIVVRTMVEAVRHNIATYDWHVSNIGFLEKGSDTLKLLDWEGNRDASASESYAERMDESMRCFAKYLPGSHTYPGHGVVAHSVVSEPAHVQVNVNAWKSIMTSVQVSFQEWWSAWKLGSGRRDMFPTETDLGGLYDALRRVARAGLLHGTPELHAGDIDTNVSGVQRMPICTTSTVGPSVPSATIATPRMQRRFQTAPTLMMSAHPFSLDIPVCAETRDLRENHEANTVIQSLTTAGSHRARSAYVGQRAARALVTAVVAENHWRAQQPFRHRGRLVTDNSVPLHIRFRNELHGLQGGFNDPGGHRPTQTRQEGDFINLLFSFLIHEMKTRNYIARMRNPPLQATSVDEFHGKNWKKFAGWLSMTFGEQARCLREFLLFKFSMDDDMRLMQPGIGGKRKRRNNACWTDFELMDDEMERLVVDVMREYSDAVEAMHQPMPAQ